MNPEILQLQNQIDALNSRLDRQDSSSTISRDQETALRQRLGFPTILSGRVLQVGGVGDVYNTQIKSTSVIVATSFDATSVAYQGSCIAGRGRIVSSDGSSKNINYIIII